MISCSSDKETELKQLQFYRMNIEGQRGKWVVHDQTEALRRISALFKAMCTEAQMVFSQFFIATRHTHNCWLMAIKAREYI